MDTNRNKVFVDHVADLPGDREKRAFAVCGVRGSGDNFWVLHYDLRGNAGIVMYYGGLLENCVVMAMGYFWFCFGSSGLYTIYVFI